VSSPATAAARLAPLEVATGIVFGRDPRGPAFARRSRQRPLDALEQALIPALSRPPCAISFSGGRDSSALLAVAVRVARREGLAPPVPVTLRFPQAGATDEDAWQEELVRRIGCDDWVQMRFTDELDLVGPVARRVMASEGLPYPYNLHLLLPLMEPAHGGSFVTGMGGDQALFSAGRPLDVLARRARPVRRDGMRIAAAAAPASLRRIALRRRVGLHYPWLSPSANAALARGWLGEEARQPLRWNARLREMWRSRFMQLSVERIASLARYAGTVPVHPFIDTGFLAALAAAAGPTGFPDRSAAMKALFADDLPDRVTTRASKASFNEVLWNRHAREFAGSLTPEAVAPLLRRHALQDFVDAESLLGHWQSGEPLANSYLLLQACWLAGQEDAS
jgi:asparagine synthetase B (glutamine-hydrolysing)